MTDPNVVITFETDGVTTVGATEFRVTPLTGLPGVDEEFVWDGTTYTIDSRFGSRIIFEPALLTEIPDNTEFTIPRPTFSTAYSFTLDTGGAVFNGAVGGNFTDNANADTALTELSSAVTTMFPTVTASTVTDGVIDGDTATMATRDTGRGPVPADEWALRDGIEVTANSVVYTTWDDWVGNFLLFQPAAGGTNTLNRLDRILVELGTASVTFNLTGANTTAVNSRLFGIDSVVTQDGTPPADGELTVTGFLDGRAISLDTNQTTNIAQTLVLTMNNGQNIESELTAINGGGTTGIASTYTLNDYAGTELAVLTATSGETLTSILGRLETVVDDNTETPIDFMAQVFIDRLVMTAQAVGSLNPGMVSTAQWAVVVNHDTGDGDIAVSGFTRSTRGRDTLSNINANVPTSGAVTFDNYHGATLGDN